MSSLNVGDYFKICGSKHWGNGEIHCATRVRRESARGNPDVPVLDLGIMVEFSLLDFFGKPMRHAMPIEWCQPCERPTVAKRVKGVAFDEGAKPEFWSDLYSACKEAK